MPEEPEIEEWERRTAWPLSIAAILFLTSYAWPILDTGISSAWELLCSITGLTMWLVFAIDYLIRLKISKNRWHYIRTHIFDLLVVLLPAFRPLRALALVNLLRIANLRAKVSIHSQVVWHIPLVMTLVLCIASLATLDAERGHPNATIVSFGDAFWWASVTVATVGYGDVYPVTATGRVIAVTLMLIGVALVGVVTASVASWFLDRGQHDRLQTASRSDIDLLRTEIAELKAELAKSKTTEAKTGQTNKPE